MKLSNKGDYIYEHSLILTYLSYLILAELDWNSKDTRYKVFLACLFHDLSLPDSKEVKVMELEIESNMTAEEIKRKHKLYYDHPLDSSMYIHEFREIPPDTNSIIAQHHEKPDGSGFPKGLRANKTFPLATLFNVAHDLLNFLYKNEFNNESIIKFVRQKEKKIVIFFLFLSNKFNY